MIRQALSTLAVLSIASVTLACDDASPDDNTQERALLYVDDEPIYADDEVPEELEPILDLVDEADFDLDAPRLDDEGIQHRATCTASCGSSNMSVSGDSCICKDGVGCTVADGGQVYAWRCRML